MLDLEQLAQQIHPERTVLLLGAGAAVSSGAPTGNQLAAKLAKSLDPAPTTTDLSQVCGIYELKRDRRDLVDDIRANLSALEPSNALLTLPTFPWRNIYSTNFDQLIEKSYRKGGIELEVVRTNYEFTPTKPGVARLYKMHGCVTKDVAYGDSARMVLTERDYDLVQEYREAIFRSLAFDLLASDTLIVGQSLADAHLREFAKEAARLRKSSGTPGRIFMVAYQRDEDQAALLEQFGLQVAFGSLEDLFYNLATIGPSKTIASSSSPIGGLVPQSLAPTCLDITHAKNLGSNALKLFNGGPASYADIAMGLTVERAVERRFMETQDSRNGFFTVLTGAAGVGKTSLARRVMYRRSETGFFCWEASDAYPLDVEGWFEVDANLRQSGRQGFLFIDDATRNLGLVNRLVDRLASLERPHLRLLLTANAGAWKSRHKSRGFFSRGSQMSLGRLTDGDLNAMINLVDNEPKIFELVDPSFRALNKAQQYSRLRGRCNSEMFVCLKNIFGSAELDYILLEEYGTLNEPEQDIYRHVAALQAMGARVHRQLVLRCLDIDAGTLEALLTLLDGIVDEQTISAREGLYQWSVRHDVIAEVIARYKFAGTDQLVELLTRVIDGINPGVTMELETARAICTTEWGIQRVPDPAEQVRMLRKLIEVLPAERIPRRRLIRRYLDSRELDEASHEVKAARVALRSDVIVDRYEVLGLLYRAEEDTRLMPEDQLAVLRDAAAKAKKLANSHVMDQQNVKVYANVGVALARRTGETEDLLEAIALFGKAESELLDPEVSRMTAMFERIARSLGAGHVEVLAEIEDLDLEAVEE